LTVKVAIVVVRSVIDVNSEGIFSEFRNRVISAEWDHDDAVVLPTNVNLPAIVPPELA
jgi:hypothetical protein